LPSQFGLIIVINVAFAATFLMLEWKSWKVPSPRGSATIL
jgi:hypothetical protein